MGYELQAVIASTDLLRAATADLAHARLAPLRQGFTLLPITDDLFDSVTDRAADQMPGFWRLPNGFDRVLAAWSHTGAVAYVEAEYFGGTGEQHAAVWHHGNLTLSPPHLADRHPLPAAGSPISRALRYLGARAGGETDEFAAVGLDQHRRIEDWIS
jgi:hypothetical protein